MKKLLAIFLSVVLLFCLAACKNENKGGAVSGLGSIENLQQQTDDNMSDASDVEQSGTNSEADNDTEETDDTPDPKPQYTQAELKAGAKIPDGCVYKDASGKTYKAGEKMPKTVSDGDEFTDSEYMYKYNYIGESVSGKDSWVQDKNKLDGWGVIALVHDKAKYGEIRSSINGKDVKSLYNTFALCEKLSQMPTLPKRVTDLRYAFMSCSSLKKAGYIPETVTDMRYAFAYCEKLATAPKTPKSAIDMCFAYMGCSSLKKAPEIVDGVKEIDGIFSECTSLSKVNKVPESVISMEGAFSMCEALTGEIVIDAQSPAYSRAFADTVELITISGKSDVLEQIAKTAQPENVVVKK